MIDVATITDEPPRSLLYSARARPLASLLALRRSRGQIAALVRRDFTARYKQTVLGLSWALLLPLITVLVFGIFIQRFAHADTHGVPYPLWSFVGLLSWNFFANSVSNGGTSLLSNQQLLNKVFCARQIYPVAGVLLAGLDAMVSLGALAVMFAVFTFAPAATCYWLPLLMLINLVFVTAVVLLVSILIVYVRDLRNIVPILLQLGLFATPVVYNLSQVGAGYQLLYSYLNPMAPLIESYRRVVLYGENPPLSLLGAGAITSMVLLIFSSWLFARFERGIVDII